MNYNRHIVAIRGDTQSGHDGGLKNPDTLLPVISIDASGSRVVDSWDPVSLRPFQQKLWEWHEDARHNIVELAGNDPITMLEMGDLTQGGYFRDNLDELQLSDQYFISRASLVPWLEIPTLQKVFISRGTQVHTWSGSSETLLAHSLQSEYAPKSVKLADHWLLNIGGVLLDIAHHGGSPGKRAWLRGNEFSIYMRSMLIDEVALGQDPPHIVLRGDKHEYTRAWAFYQVGGRYWDVHGIITPPMCYIGSYATAAMSSPIRQSCGMLALELINGKLHEVHPFVHYIDLRTLEVL